jgi:cell division protein FtsA
MAENKMLTVVDVGSTKIATLTCEANASSERGYSVVGVGVAPAAGIRRGQVINVGDATKAIQESLAGAVHTSGFKTTNVLMSISGAHIDSQNNHGAVAIGRGDEGVSEDDIQRGLEAAQAITVPNNRDILHVIPRHFKVDDQDGVRNPTNMLGFRLEVQAHIVTCATTAMQNLLKCANGAGLQVDELVLAPLASSQAVLTSTEKEMGSILVDMGGGTTTLAVYIDGAPWHSHVLEIGGSHFTSDLAMVLRLPMEVAEQLKVQFGHANPNDVSADQLVDIAGFGDEPKVRVAKREIADILQARAEELFTMIEQEIKRSGYDGLLPAGLVVTGGGSQLPGVRDVARNVVNRPVRLAKPMNLVGLTDSIQTPAFSAAVGLLDWGFMSMFHAKPSAKVKRTGKGKVRDWLNNLLPKREG